MGLAISNLIDNAIRYSADRKELTVVARPAPSGAHIDVRDAGRGIPEHELSLVARKFFRGRDSGSGGSGLGLYIAQQIVRDHGGALTISSRPNEGTTVTISLRGATADDEEADPDR
jgi:two-component system sensor histidine kinase ArlS